MSKRIELSDEEAAALADQLLEDGSAADPDGEPLDRTLQRLDDPVAKCMRELAYRVRRERKPEDYPKCFPIGETTVTVPEWVVGACLDALQRVGGDWDTEEDYRTVHKEAGSILRKTLREHTKEKGESE